MSTSENAASSSSAPARRARRRAALSAALAVATTVLGGCATADGPAETVATGSAAPVRSIPSGWSPAADGPLSPRYAPLMVTVGDQVLVMGGHGDVPCPPNADCIEPTTPLGDAARYDLGDDGWTSVADPPVHVTAGTDAAVVGDLVVVRDHRDWFTYDVEADAWEPLVSPGTDMVGGMVADDGLVYVRKLLTSPAMPEVRVLDVAARTWSVLPRDPLTPAVPGGGLFVTDAGIVVTGKAYEETDPAPSGSYVDLFDGVTWTRLSASDRLASLQHSTGERLISLENGRGEMHAWGTEYPYGAALDPITGEWSAVPGPPGGFDSWRGTGWELWVGEGPLVATAGRVYDDRTGTWVDLGRPETSVVDDHYTGVWADGRLVVFGGYDEDVRDTGGLAGLSGGTWVWSPES